MRIAALFSEGLLMAKDALVRNKLRSFLSVLGITIGIYCIIIVYSLVHSIEKNLNDSFASMGTDVLFVQKWPWDEFGENYPWWKYLGRPQTSLEEAEFLEKNLSAKFNSGIAFSFSDRKNIAYGKASLSDASVHAVSYSYNAIQKVEIGQGRYFSIQETENARAVVILGAVVAENLFENTDPIGKNVRIGNLVCTVIGVCAKQGASMINNSSDEVVYIPVKFALHAFNYKEGEKGCQIMIKSSGLTSLDELTFEVSQLMRRYRRISATGESSFAVNRMSMITSVISGFFNQIKIIGLIIGGFSMIVGCFGVANIMFVSVKERTQEIGIQKALGARKIFILSQFIMESVMLCIVGGLVGLSLVWLSLKLFGYILTHQMDSSIKLYLSNSDIGIGILVSVLVGLVAGFLPALTGSRLNPVDAIRSK